MQSSSRDDEVVRALSEYVLANGGEISSTSGVADFYRQAGDHEDLYKETLRGLGKRKAEVYKFHGLMLEKRNVGSDVIKLIDDPARGEPSQAIAKYKWKATKVEGANATREGGGGGDFGSTDEPADQRAPPSKLFAQDARSFGDRCRFRHDRTNSSMQSSARSASGPRQPRATRLKCTAEVVKLIRKADDEFGFLRIHPACMLAMSSVFDSDEMEKDHYFRLEWLPSVGQKLAPVREGDTLSCLIGVDARASAASDRSRIKLRQLMLEKCSKLTEEEMFTYLKAVHEMSESEPEEALIMIGKCAAPWRYILQRHSLDAQVTLMLLRTLQAILSSPAMQEKQHDLISSFGDSHFLLRDGPLSCLLRQSRQRADSDSSKTDQLVRGVIEGTLLIAPEVALALYHVLEEFFRPDGPWGEMLLRVIRRLLPASVRVEQSQWNELPLVASPHELLGEVDPLLFTPRVEATYSSAADYFDTYFRLMRCEGFGELSNGIGSFLKGKLDARDMNVYKDVTVQGVRFGTGADGAMTIALSYSPLTKRVSKAAVEIMFGNLLCISVDGSFKEPLWAVVAHCEVDKRQACAHVRLCTEYNQSDDLEALLRLQRCKTTLMAESPTYFNAVRPVLRALQLHDPSSLPFESELVHGRRPSADGRSFLNYLGLQESLSPAAPEYIKPDLCLDMSSVFPGSVLTAKQCIQRLKDPGELQTSFDKSQRLAIAAALQQRVAVIQGPPGTGKSFVGRVLACMLLQLIDGPVLVLTYKNHALDEFLEGCVDRVGLGAIARLGSRSESLRLAERNIKALLRDRELTKRVVNPQTEDSVRDLRAQIQELVPRLAEVVAQRRSAAYITKDSALAAFLAQADERLLRQLWLHPKHGLDGKEVALLERVEVLVSDAQVEAKMGGEDEPSIDSFRGACTYCVLTEQKHRHVEQSARVMLPWDASLLEIEAKMQSAITKLAHKMVCIFKEWMPLPSGFHAIQRRIRDPILPDTIAATGVDALGLAQVDATDMIDAIDVTARRTMADDNHSKLHWDEGFISLAAGKTDEYSLDELDQPLAEVERQTLRTRSELWGSNEMKMLLCHMLMGERLTSLDEALRSLTSKYNGLLKELHELEQKRQAEVLRSMKLVGMTSTGAALNMGMLAILKPKVIIVEEAAELLEPQLLAVLQPSVQHLIMIGDHEQLRPQVAHHELVRTRHFDVSMFERLVQNGMLSGSLKMQSRMRPEMVELLRPIYPHVKNHERVLGPDHDVPACLVHSMFFWSHNHPEQAERSVMNEKEAQMIMRLITWLTAEGHEPETITVIAAYSQQVRRLRELVREIPILMRTKAANGVPGEQARPTARLRVVTIDEFQGDENEIIICSFVRSCPDPQAPGGGRQTIGYLQVRNRLVVAASRAKRALVFVGNAEWLSSRTEVLLKHADPRLARWDKLVQHMATNDLVDSSLPLRCPRHPHAPPLLLSSASMALPPRCPLPCDEMMECSQHRCPIGRCHPVQGFQDAHSADSCKVVVDFRCFAMGHANRRKCCEPVPNCEHEVAFRFARCMHDGVRKCCVPKEEMECRKFVPMIFARCGHAGTRRCISPEVTQKCTRPCERKLPCGHPCPLLCFDDCSKAVANCAACAEKRKAEEQERQRQLDEAIKSAKAKAKNEAKFHRDHGGFVRQPLETSDPGYMEACKIVYQNQQPDHNNPIVVVGVERVYNAAEQVKFFECQQDMIDPTQTPLYKFHGTDTAGVDGICRDGFRQPDASKPNMDKKSGGKKLPMYGHGIYLASDSTKSAQAEYTRGSNMLLVCKTLLGKSLTLEKADNHITKKSIRKRGFDSVFARAGTAVRFDEYIVYDARQCVVEWIVHFKSGHARPASTPWSVKASAIGTATCRELVESKLGSKVSRELEEFNFAHGHYARLVGSQIKAVRQIDVYDSPEVDAKFRAKYEEFCRAGKPTDAYWVFHGCPTSKAIKSICLDGFKVGGQDGHPISHGNAHGQGVYTATGPGTPMGYGSPSHSVILCKALAGSEGPEGQGDHWKPCGDWMIFKTAAQLQPKYVVHFE